MAKMRRDENLRRHVLIIRWTSFADGFFGRARCGEELREEESWDQR